MKILLSAIIGITLMRKHGIVEIFFASVGIYLALGIIL